MTKIIHRDLAPYTPSHGMAFQVLPSRNPLISLWPYLKVTLVFLMGFVACGMMLMVGR